MTWLAARRRRRSRARGACILGDILRDAGECNLHRWAQSGREPGFHKPTLQTLQPCHCRGVRFLPSQVESLDERLNEWAPAGLEVGGLLLTMAGAVFTRTFRGVYDASAGLCVQLQRSLTVG
uniref:Uncharacterized protein n=1 Tax=Paenarthrobacter aurescens TaxID=43663 RepID=Q6SJZ6_PAEAU|nr:hypothetical protein [Paenarthrobacter aurescens]